MNLLSITLAAFAMFASIIVATPVDELVRDHAHLNVTLPAHILIKITDLSKRNGSMGDGPQQTRGRDQMHGGLWCRKPMQTQRARTMPLREQCLCAPGLGSGWQRDLGTSRGCYGYETLNLNW